MAVINGQFVEYENVPSEYQGIGNPGSAGQDPMQRYQNPVLSSGSTDGAAQQTYTPPEQGMTSAEGSMIGQGVKLAAGVVSGIATGAMEKATTDAARSQAKGMANQNRQDTLAETDRANRYEQERLEHHKQAAAIDTKLQQKKIQYDDWLYHFKQHVNSKQITNDAVKGLFETINSTPNLQGVLSKVGRQNG